MDPSTDTQIKEITSGKVIPGKGKVALGTVIAYWDDTIMLEHRVWQEWKTEPWASCNVNHVDEGCIVSVHLSLHQNWEGVVMIKKQLLVANRTREIRPSGMRGGLYGNVMKGCCSNSHETGNSGYESKCPQPNYVCAVILLDEFQGQYTKLNLRQ